MRNVFLVLFVASISFLSSCEKEESDTVNQDRIYTTYEFFYSKNTDKTIVVAQFILGSATGTVIELTDGATVTFNNDPLIYSSWHKGHMKEYDGKISTGDFKYKDVEGTVYTNTAPSFDEAAFPTTLDTIIKSQINTVEWVGNGLATDETIGIFIGSWTWGEDPLFIQGENNSSEIELGITKLSSIADGLTTMYLDRTIQKPLSQGTSKGGFIKSTYRTQNIEVTVVP